MEYKATLKYGIRNGNGRGVICHYAHKTAEHIAKAQTTYLYVKPFL